MKAIQLVSGGQTGVDRAALDLAQSLGMRAGGWCPRGRRAEDGLIPARYQLRETPSKCYSQRTEWNIRDSDATLILCCGKLVGGTALTLQLAQKLKRPHLVVDLKAPVPISTVRAWLKENDVRILNVAGPRESGAAGIAAEATCYLRRVFEPS